MTVAFMGIGGTAVDRKPAHSIVGYAMDAALAAVEDAGLTLHDIDGYVGSAAGPNPSAVHVDGADEVSMYLLTERLGLSNLGWVADVQGMPAGMAVAAATALQSGACRYVLGMRVQYPTPGRKYGAGGGAQAHGVDQFTLPFGAGPAGTRFALWTRRYLEQSGATRADLYDVVSAARAHAALNPLALWRDRSVELDEYLSARMISDPLCLFDCDMPVYGAAAFVMSTGDRASDGPHRPAHVVGWSNWTQPADRLFADSKRDRDDIDLCQLYDGYSPFIYQALEDLGFCAPSQAWRYVSAGATRPGGAFPVNTFGGALGEGRLHGIGHLREAILQISGRAESRQVANAHNCVVQIGPPDKSWRMVISTDG